MTDYEHILFPANISILALQMGLCISNLPEIAQTKIKS